MKLTALKSLELKAIEFPERVPVPEWADSNKISDRIFGAFCRINPELSCLEDKKFIKNVFTCIKAAGGKDLLSNNNDLVDFVKTNKEIAKWRSWYATQKEIKAEFRKANKDKIKKENEERKVLYGKVLVNEKEEPLQSWTVEPEGIFFGRGESPLNGFWKAEIKVNDITVNTNSKNLPKMITNKNGEKVVEDKKDWIIKWDPNSHFAAQYDIKVGIPDEQGNIKKPKANKYKMIAFAATSSITKEGQSKKYAAASELGKAYEEILKIVNSDLEEAKRSNNIDKIGTDIAVFLLFEKGIRIGDKIATVNNTKGLLSLVWNKDVKRLDNKIKFDFFGKDSVRDTSSIETNYADVIEKHWDKFKQLNTDKFQIKQFIAKIVPGLADVFSPKLCRTAVAAHTANQALDEMVAKYKITKESSVTLKKIAFDEAVMQVAKRLNHQRGVNRAAEEKRKVKFIENENKLKERKQKVKEQIAKKEAKIKTLKDRNKIKALKESILSSKEKIKQAELKLDSKERNQNFTASTALNAYIDSSIVFDWCNKFDMPVEKIYSKSQLEKFAK